ncbi:MAG: hypothetical protein OHK0021_08880 [Bryobacter sp.]
MGKAKGIEQGAAEDFAGEAEIKVAADHFLPARDAAGGRVNAQEVFARNDFSFDENLYGHGRGGSRMKTAECLRRKQNFSVTYSLCVACLFWRYGPVR